jgi:hypothetical protein
MGKYILRIALVLMALFAIVWAGDVYYDRTYKLAVESVAPLYSLPPHEYPTANSVMANLIPGEEVRVLRLRYGKDFQAFQVETKAGLIGWVIGGEGIKVVSHG